MTHSTVARFEVLNGYLCVGGVPLDRLTARVGSTPYFAYDRELVRRADGASCGGRSDPTSRSGMRSRPTRCRPSSS